jgi:hypothetical protein
MAGLQAISGDQQLLGTLVRVIGSGTQALDAVMLEMGRMVAESIMLIEREELAGPDYYPTHPGLQKWAHEAGSAYIGDQKVKVTRPRLRDVEQGEVPLKSYARLHATGDFSEERLEKILRGGEGSPNRTIPRLSSGRCGPSACRHRPCPPRWWS